MTADVWHCWGCLEILPNVGLGDRIRSQTGVVHNCLFTSPKCNWTANGFHTNYFPLAFEWNWEEGVVYPISLVQLKLGAASLCWSCCFPLHVSHKEAKECEICDSVCGFVTCRLGLKMIEILVLPHWKLGKCVSFIAFVGFSFKQGFFNEEEQYLSF